MTTMNSSLHSKPSHDKTYDEWSRNSWHRWWLVSAPQQYASTQIKAEYLVSCCCLRVFASSHLAARLALLLCVDVDGRLVDARECVVSWIVSGGMGQKNGHCFDTNFLETHGRLILGFWAVSWILRHLHGAVGPLLVADKVVGGEHHLTDVTVKTCLMPVLSEKKDQVTVFYRALTVELKIHDGLSCGHGKWNLN